MATEILEARAPAGSAGGRPRRPDRRGPVDHGDGGGEPRSRLRPRPVRPLGVPGHRDHDVHRVHERLHRAPHAAWTGGRCPRPRCSAGTRPPSCSAARPWKWRAAGAPPSTSPGLRRWLGATGLLGPRLRGRPARGLARCCPRAASSSPSNPHSSFFYLLSGVHLAHLAGGLVWFALVLRRLRGHARTRTSAGRGALSLFATYWHFLGLLWVYVLLLIFVF